MCSVAYIVMFEPVLRCPLLIIVVKLITLSILKYVYYVCSALSATG